MLNGVVEAFAEFSYTKKNFLMLFGRFRGEQSIRTLRQVLLPCTLFRTCQIFPSSRPPQVTVLVFATQILSRQVSDAFRGPTPATQSLFGGLFREAMV